MLNHRFQALNYLTDDLEDDLPLLTVAKIALDFANDFEIISSFCPDNKVVWAKAQTTLRSV